MPAGAKRSPIRAMLGRHVERVSWDEAPFGEVLDWLRRQSTRHGKVNVRPRWRALAVAGIDDQTPVTLELEDVTVAVVLHEVLDQLSGPDPVMYVAKGNVLTISTKSNIRGRLFTRTYDVSELLARARGLRVAPQLAIGRQIHVVTAFNVPGAGVGVTTQPIDLGTTLFGPGNAFDPNNPFGRPDDDDDDEDLEEEFARELMTWIQTVIEPDSWVVNGGRGTLSIFDVLLVVRNSADVHELLGGSFRVDK